MASAAPAARPAVPGEVDPIRLVLKHLRGRIPVAIMLGVVFAIAGGVGPWLVLKPMYEARGLIRVAPSGRVILYPTEDNQPMSHYDSFVNTQQQLLTSRRILGAALEDPRLGDTSWPKGSSGIRQLVDALAVSRSRGAEIITVALKHEDPQLAAVALNSVLEAYREIQIEGELLQSQGQERLLEDRITTLTASAATQRAQARSLALPVTPDALTRMLEVRTNDLATIRSMITQVHMRPEDPSGSGSDPNIVPNIPVAEMNDEQLTSMLMGRDQQFASLVDMLRTSQRELLVLSDQVGPLHRQYTQLSRNVATVQATVDDRLEAFRNELLDAEALAAANPPEPGQPAAAPPLTLMERLQAEEQQISGEIASLATKLYGVQTYLEEAERLEGDISTTRQRLERLRFERQDQNFGRITIEEYAAPPTSPSTDRRLPLSAAAALAGLGGGAGLVVLFGMLRPSMRYSTDASDLKTTTPLLAAIPDVSTGDTHDRQAAAFCIHHLRHLIEASTQNRTPLTLAITSPGPGDGKTQLTLGLAASFSSAGRRVLAIDLDFVGRGLSRATALDEVPGVAEHLATGMPLDKLFSTTPEHAFTVLPSGQPGPEFAATLDTARIRAILAAQRDRFDVVIIDTGPILGSLEAGAVVGATSSCLTVVGRGQKAPLVQASLARIAALGGHSLGLVFNRASSMDVNSSVGSISLRSSATNGHANGAGRHPKSTLYTAIAQTPQDSDRA